MCSGLLGKQKAPTVQQVAPAPTQVSNSDVGATQSADAEAARAARRERLKKGYASTQLSTDRNTILSGATGRKTLG